MLRLKIQTRWRLTMGALTPLHGVGPRERSAHGAGEAAGNRAGCASPFPLRLKSDNNNIGVRAVGRTEAGASQVRGSTGFRPPLPPLLRVAQRVRTAGTARPIRRRVCISPRKVKQRRRDSPTSPNRGPCQVPRIHPRPLAPSVPPRARARRTGTCPAGRALARPAGPHASLRIRDASRKMRAAPHAVPSLVPSPRAHGARGRGPTGHDVGPGSGGLRGTSGRVGSGRPLVTLHCAKRAPAGRAARCAVARYRQPRIPRRGDRPGAPGVAPSGGFWA
ncbi:unnamed protein product [Lampetra fluviatilis]